MKQNKNKQPARPNYDYLNFIRRNQQIVKEFKQISKSENKPSELNKLFSKSANQNHFAYGTARYVEPSPRLQGAASQRESSKKQIRYLKDLAVQAYHQESEMPIKSRKNMELTEKIAQMEMYTRNFVIPAQITHRNSFRDIKEANSEVKFPRLSSRLMEYEQQPEQSRKVETSHSVEKQTIRTKQTKIQREEQGESFTPVSSKSLLAQKQAKCNIKSLKFGEGTKNSVNNKIVKTYYDFQNVVSLRERVSDLMPVFKPLQSKKKQRPQIIPRDLPHGNNLEQFLQANMIKHSAKKLKLGQQQKSSPSQGEVNNYQTINPQTNQLQTETFKKQSESLNLQKANELASSPSKNRTGLKKQAKYLQGPSNSQEQTVYQNKVASYRQFLFLVNFAHRVFDPLILRDDPDKLKVENKYKYYIGPGNNSLLIKSLLKRRFWWVQVDDPKQAHFVWTQLKINLYYQFQKKTALSQKYDKLDEFYPNIGQKNKKALKSKTKLDLSKKQQQPNKVGGILRGQLPEGEKKIMTTADVHFLNQMTEKAREQNPGLKNFNKFQKRIKHLPAQFLQKRDSNYSEIRMHNHFFYNFEIGNKKALFYNLKHYYELMQINPFNTIPLTFHIKKGLNDPEYAKFMKQYKKIKADLDKAEKDNTSKKKLSRNVWIVKPGELSNRGNGITVIDEIYQLNNILKNKAKHSNGADKTYIVQKYIEKPMLYKNRKFDIRHYMMISRLHGRMRAYWFSEGYIRTSSYEYNLEQVGDVMIHLTNDAVQKHGTSYGKYEEGNKLSYAQFQRYLDSTYPQKKYSFLEAIYPRMRQIATDAVKSTYLWMDPDALEHNFEVFGLDFMIDANFNVWLIEVNTNPCLELSSGLLGRIIPTMVQHAFRLSLDPIFPPTAHYANTIKYLAPDSPMERLQFELIFDESRDGKQIEEMLRKHGKVDCGQIQEEDETYQNDGKQIDLGGELE